MVLKDQYMDRHLIYRPDSQQYGKYAKIQHIWFYISLMMDIAPVHQHNNAKKQRQNADTVRNNVFAHDHH